MLDGRDEEFQWFRAKAKTSIGGTIHVNFRARNAEEAIKFLQTQGYKDYELVESDEAR